MVASRPRRVTIWARGKLPLSKYRTPAGVYVSIDYSFSILEIRSGNLRDENDGRFCLQNARKLKIDDHYCRQNRLHRILTQKNLDFNPEFNYNSQVGARIDKLGFHSGGIND
uniref:Uncharacterized protein n=1 Tax=Romanomermis culicivorax TaxID=13658 RepID=A0A915I1X2_ROMCU